VAGNGNSIQFQSFRNAKATLEDGQFSTQIRGILVIK